MCRLVYSLYEKKGLFIPWDPYWTPTPRAESPAVIQTYQSALYSALFGSDHHLNSLPSPRCPQRSRCSYYTHSNPDLTTTISRTSSPCFSLLCQTSFHRSYLPDEILTTIKWSLLRLRYLKGTRHYTASRSPTVQLDMTRTETVLETFVYSLSNQPMRLQA